MKMATVIGNGESDATEPGGSEVTPRCGWSS